MAATVLRLLADDLTGALDAGAPFIARTGSLPVYWSRGSVPLPEPGASLVLDSESRELKAKAAAAAVARLAPILTGAGIAFKKIDSLLRGHVAVELDACLRAARFAACILAPAFPFQGRVTRGGRQHVRGPDPGGWTPVAVDLGAELAALGRPVVLARRPDDVLRAAGVPGAVALCDAETDDDLAAVLAAGRRLAGPVLWCGTGGLAAALAGTGAVEVPPPRPPLLVVVGTDHPVARRQVERLMADRSPAAVELDDIIEGTPARLRAGLERSGLALLTFAVPPGSARDAAAARIRDRLHRLLPTLGSPPAAGLIVTGGATLLAVAEAVGADHLELLGQIMPGVPVSRLQGGLWDGVAVASKSGAFGEPDLLTRLTASP